MCSANTRERDATCHARKRTDKLYASHHTVRAPTAHAQLPLHRSAAHTQRMHSFSRPTARPARAARTRFFLPLASCAVLTRETYFSPLHTRIGTLINTLHCTLLHKLKTFTLYTALSYPTSYPTLLLSPLSGETLLRPHFYPYPLQIAWWAYPT